MIWLRLIVIILALLMLIFILFFLISGDEEQPQQESRFIPQKIAAMKKVPGIQSFLMRKSKPYSNKIAVEIQVDTCAICIDEFSESDGRLIAELNCD
jgi:flagellar basal body-associated protein FliL